MTHKKNLWLVVKARIKIIKRKESREALKIANKLRKKKLMINKSKRSSRIIMEMII